MSFAVFESMNPNNWSPVFPLMSAPIFTSASAEVLPATHESLNLSGPLLVENQPNNNTFPSDSEKELDFFAELLMDFSKGIYSAAVAQDAPSGKRKTVEGDAPFKKGKRMPRSPSINALIAEQTIACEEHSSKHVRCPLNCPNRRPGSKRVRTVLNEESRVMFYAPENQEQIESVETSVQHETLLQPMFNPLTKTFELSKPESPEEHIQTLRWALLQLPSIRGSFEEIFNVIRKNGWKELKFGTLKEMLACKKNFEKYLDTSFDFIQGNNETVFYSKDITPDFSLKDVKKPPKAKAMKEPMSPSSDMSPLGSPSLSTSQSEEIIDEQSEEQATPEKKKKGRRWLRFACEKHRREHTKCSENCPHRKVTYTVRGADGN